MHHNQAQHIYYSLLFLEESAQLWVILVCLETRTNLEGWNGGVGWWVLEQISRNLGWGRILRMAIEWVPRVKFSSLRVLKKILKSYVKFGLAQLWFAQNQQKNISSIICGSFLCPLSNKGFVLWDFTMQQQQLFCTGVLSKDAELKQLSTNFVPMESEKRKRSCCL